MTRVSQACAECLETAGGRQQLHGISWRFDFCGCCGKRQAVTDPLNFGNPPLQAQVLEFVTHEKEFA